MQASMKDVFARPSSIMKTCPNQPRRPQDKLEENPLRPPTPLSAHEPIPVTHGYNREIGIGNHHGSPRRNTVEHRYCVVVPIRHMACQLQDSMGARLDTARRSQKHA
jgi:hypothetical protein